MNLPVKAGAAACMGILLTTQLVHAAAYESLGRVHLSLAPDQIVRSANVGAFEPFDVYVLLEFETTSFPGITMVETGLRFHETVAFYEVDQMDTVKYVMLGLEPGLVQLAFGWDCKVPDVGLTPVLRLGCVLQEEVSDVLIGIDAVDPGSFDGLGPGWWACDESSFLFEEEQSGWSKLQINQIVAADTESWGAVKALFQERLP